MMCDWTAGCVPLQVCFPSANLLYVALGNSVCPKAVGELPHGLVCSAGSVGCSLRTYREQPDLGTTRLPWLMSLSLVLVWGQAAHAVDVMKLCSLTQSISSLLLLGWREQLG